MAAGMHHPLACGGVGQTGALLHRQSIHIHPQAHRGTVGGSEFSNHTGTAHSLLNPPSCGSQLTGYEGRGLVFLTTELRVRMQVTPQFDQLRQLLIQVIQNVHPFSRARKAISWRVGWGGQRRTSSSQSRWR